MKSIQLSPPIASKIPKQFKINLPNFAGYGGYVIDTIKPGLQLAVADYQLHEPSSIDYDFPVVDCGFGFCLEGFAESRIDGKGKTSKVQSGQSGFFTFGEKVPVTEAVSQGRTLRATFLMEEQLCEELTGFSLSELSSGMAKQNPFYRQVDTITPVMKAALWQVLNCPYQGKVRQLYLESKVMELLAYKLEQLRLGGTTSNNVPFVKKVDIARVEQAAELLIHDLENAPDLSLLAHSVGLSRSKLHRCFCVVYGMTPFEYLRHYRLQTAKLLLQQGEINVTEAAFSVGYANLSFFAKAFKAMFGVTPSEICQKNSR